MPNVLPGTQGGHSVLPGSYLKFEDTFAKAWNVPYGIWVHCTATQHGIMCLLSHNCFPDFLNYRSTMYVSGIGNTRPLPGYDGTPIISFRTFWTKFIAPRVATRGHIEAALWRAGMPPMVEVW